MSDLYLTEIYACIEIINGLLTVYISWTVNTISKITVSHVYMHIIDQQKSSVRYIYYNQ